MCAAEVPEALVPEALGSKLTIGGFVYNISKRYRTHRYWNCELKRREECDARAITNDTPQGYELVKGPAHVPLHSHPPNHAAVRAERVRLQLKRRAVDEPEAPPPGFYEMSWAVSSQRSCRNCQLEKT